MNMQSKSLGRSSALPACSAAVVRGFPLSSYGLVSVPARNAPACSAFCPPFPAFLCVSVLVLSYGDYSGSGGVNLAGMWWRSVGFWYREVVWKGGGAGFEPMTCSVEVCCVFEPVANAVLRQCLKSVATHHPFYSENYWILLSYCVSNENSLISALQWYSDA